MGLRIEGLGFDYGREGVIEALDLRVERGDLFALLGPSGCGKSTLLHLIAGLLKPREGKIIVDQEDVTSLPPERRRFGVVFQSYALFPAMSALENIRFGPRQWGVDSKESTRRAHELAEQLGLERFLERRPSQLSGGQQQRVALARALALRPRLLLMDEPLSNIDPALRGSVRTQLRELQSRFDITTVFVTHDREDAFWLADHMGLLRKGRLVQTGSPQEIYTRPQDVEAAELLGPINRIPVYRAEDGSPRWQVEGGDTREWALVRPERLQFDSTPGEAELKIEAVVESVVDLGGERRALCRTRSREAFWAGSLGEGTATGIPGWLCARGEIWFTPHERAGAS